MKGLPLRTYVDRLEWIESHLLSRLLASNTHLLEPLLHSLHSGLLLLLSLRLNWIPLLWRFIPSLRRTILRLPVLRLTLLGLLLLCARIGVLWLLRHPVRRLLLRLLWLALCWIAICSSLSASRLLTS